MRAARVGAWWWWGALSSWGSTVPAVIAAIQGNSACCSSAVSSGSPHSRFMFWIACPEAPFTRLSITAAGMGVMCVCVWGGWRGGRSKEVQHLWGCPDSGAGVGAAGCVPSAAAAGAREAGGHTATRGCLQVWPRAVGLRGRAGTAGGGGGAIPGGGPSGWHRRGRTARQGPNQ